MGNRSRLSARAWIVIPLVACGFLFWMDVVRGRHVEYVSAMGETSKMPVASGASGPDQWRPALIVPEHRNASYEWLDQVRQMFDQNAWRVRHVDYENAPYGRDVSAPSPYRWWLELIAWCGHEISGQPVDQSLEWSALVADPLLHLLLLLGVVFFTARSFGVFPAIVVAGGVATLFPFAAAFLPGAPDDGGLARAGAIWSVLLLVGGAAQAFSAAADSAARARRRFFAAGVAGGLALWISPSDEVPVLAGVAVGAVAAAWVERDQLRINPTGAAQQFPWRHWALGGALTILGAYLVEYFPSYLGNWQLQAVHPIYGLAWLGGGEVLARVAAGIRERKLGRRPRDLLAWVFAAAAVAGLPVAMRLTHNQGFLLTDLTALRLAWLPNGASAENLSNWVFRDGFTPMVWATLLPALVVIPAFCLLGRRGNDPGPRAAIAIALGPVLVALGFACRYLDWWNGVDAALLGLLVAVTWRLQNLLRSRSARWTWLGIVGLVLLPGAIQLVPRSAARVKQTLDLSDAYTLIERDLARWLALRSGSREIVVLAPHNQTYTMYYYGGLRGLVTLSRENRGGFEAAMRIVSASTPEEAKELIDRRQVAYIVIPSWDSSLDVYARMGMGTLEGTFLNRLHFWKLPAWLQPVPYTFPTIAGFEGQNVIILEVVEDQDDAAAFSRVAEYFVEMGQLDAAASAAQSLRRFPADLGALAARAQIDLAREDAAGFSQTFALLRSRLSGGADRNMPWDRRVSLAVVLARGHEADQSRKEVQRCLADIDEPKLRSLTTGSLYRMQVLVRAFGLQIADPRLKQLALDLLPVDLRSRLHP